MTTTRELAAARAALEMAAQICRTTAAGARELVIAKRALGDTTSADAFCACEQGHINDANAILAIRPEDVVEKISQQQDNLKGSDDDRRNDWLSNRSCSETSGEPKNGRYAAPEYRSTDSSSGGASSISEGCESASGAVESAGHQDRRSATSDALVGEKINAAGRTNCANGSAEPDQASHPEAVPAAPSPALPEVPHAFRPMRVECARCGDSFTAIARDPHGLVVDKVDYDALRAAAESLAAEVERMRKERS